MYYVDIEWFPRVPNPVRYHRFLSAFLYYAFLQIYDENELLRGKLDILNKTNMVDYAIDIRKQLYPDQEIPEVCINETTTV